MNKLRSMLTNGSIKPPTKGAEGDSRAHSLDTTSSMNTVETDVTASSSVTDCPFLGHRLYAPVSELYKQSLGGVYLAKNRETGGLVAIKLVERGASVTRHVAAELLAHRRCAGHPFITQLVEVFLTPRHLAIVLEYVAGGDLLELVDARGGLPEDEARRLFQQLAVGMLYLHSLGVHGREMKLDNKLLAYPGAELAAEGGSAAARLAASAGPAAPAVGRPTLKIQDFTYSRSDQINSDPHSALGSLPFTSPEALDNSMASGPAADVWALGVALYKMSTGLYPFERPEDGAKPRAAIQAVLARIARADYALPPALSPPLRDLLARMLVRDPRERLALEDVPRHPWFLAELPPGLLEVNAGVDPEASAKQGEAALRALVVEAAAPLRTVDAEYVEDMADEILNEEEADDLLDELNLGHEPWSLD